MEEKEIDLVGKSEDEIYTEYTKIIDEIYNLKDKWDSNKSNDESNKLLKKLDERKIVDDND